MVEEGRRRVVISDVTPQVDGGRFPIKRVVGETVVVEADVFADGHDVLSCELLYRKEGSPDWHVAEMVGTANDRWRGSFVVAEIGRYEYTPRGWVDQFKSWRQGLAKKAEARVDTPVDFLSGADIVEAAGARAGNPDAASLKSLAKPLGSDANRSEKLEVALGQELGALMGRYPDYRFAAICDIPLAVVVDRERARFSAWYEFFPRSCAPSPGGHATFKDCEERLRYVAAMGFDVVYFPPIHPIGRVHRKGKNNTPAAGPEDPGSPWAVGSQEGGHKAVHPSLGTLQDFRNLVVKARHHGMEIALDLAFQCAPDHPYVQDHLEWFRRRPDGTVQYAENPPKKYEDIYPLDFECDQWRALWNELESVVRFWIDQGVRIFRVDNPHTKPFGFWEWLLGRIKEDYPDVIFLSEAFTRPKVMYRLAKIGFSQSYTYFAWRNAKSELEQYATELARSELQEYLRPNFWPNTPDILPEYLQMGGRPAFISRLVLAATLSASYGIYGPAFELCEAVPREAGSEEYLNSEKYEIKHGRPDRPGSLKDYIARINRIRRENAALQSNRNLHFHEIDNEELLCYTKHTDDMSDIVLVAVNLDPHHVHHGWINLPLEKLGLDPKQPYQVHDLISDVRYLWHGARNYVRLDPAVSPAHVFRLRRHVRTERDFDYFM